MRVFYVTLFGRSMVVTLNTFKLKLIIWWGP
jgi:hypothetical protein